MRGRRAFITGGSQGIGLAIGRELARRGASVWLGARGEPALAAAVAEMEGRRVDPGQRFGYAILDVTAPDRVRAAVPGVLAGLGGLDVLVANAGRARPGFIADQDDDVFLDMLHANYLGHVHVARAFLPHLVGQRSGTLLFVSSVLGFCPVFGYGAYAASKHAISGFAGALRQEVADAGVRVSILYPPTTRTPGLDEENRAKPPAVWAMESESALGGIWEPDAVARAAVRAIESGRFENAVGFSGRVLLFVVRHLPRLARALADRDMRAAVARVRSSRSGG